MSVMRGESLMSSSPSYRNHSANDESSLNMLSKKSKASLHSLNTAIQTISKKSRLYSTRALKPHVKASW